MSAIHKSVFIFLFLSTLIFAVSASATETVTLNSYLPGPHATVQTLVLNPHTESTTAGCTAGRIYIDTSGNLQICQDDGLGSTNYSYPSGSWKSTGNYVYPTATVSNSSLRVGVGTTVPSERFHLKDGNFLASYQTGTSSQNNVLYFDTTNATLIAGYQAAAVNALSGRGGQSSATFGYGSLASGRYSFATGYANTASGQGSFSAGENNTASGDASTALGAGATAAGGASFATGASTANGKFSTAIGYGNTANGHMSAAIGYGNTTNNSTGTATIDTAYASPTAAAVGAVALGVSNTVNGVGGVGLGYGNTVTGDYSGTLGYGINVTGSNSVGIGVGSGAKTFTANRALGMLGGQVMISTDVDTPAWWLGTLGGTLYVEGRIVSDNDSLVNAVSDIRMKTNISSITNGLNIITQLNPIQYQLIEPSLDNSGLLHFDVKPENIRPEIQTGMSAQEVYKVYPLAVAKPTDESKSIWLMSYGKFIPILIQAVKEHKAETDVLKARIDELEKKIEQLIK